MAQQNEQYSVLYKVSVNVSVNNQTYNIPTSSIISIAMIHQYDTLSFPIIRIKLETDLSILQNLLEYPDDITILGSLQANMYRIDHTDENIQINVVNGATNIPFTLKAYIENKNMPTSKMDQYDNGIQRDDSLNVNQKIRYEIYGYNQELIYKLKRLVPSVYHNISIQGVMEDMLQRQGIYHYNITTIDQQTKFDQVLIPNMDIIQAFSYFDHYYGLYTTGGQIYGDINQLFITSSSTNVHNGSVIGIQVETYKSNSDMGGYQKQGSDYMMHVLAGNVSILTESDIERILQADAINAVNVNTDDVQYSSLQSIYTNSTLSGKEGTPNILHKHTNPYVASTQAARIKEKTTQIDLSCTGIDIGNININSRINLIYNTAIRGRDVSGMYRISYANHVLQLLDGELFCSTSTFKLCKNN